MKKIILIYLLLFILLPITIMATDTYLKSENTIKINSETMQFDNEIYNIDGRIYVSIRELFEKMRIPVLWNDEVEQVEVLTEFKSVHTGSKTQEKKDGVIPDKETAYEVGKILLEKYADKPMEYETEDKIYYLFVSFMEDFNSWKIQQTFKFKDGSVWGSTAHIAPAIILNKNTGEVLSINTYSDLPE